MEENKKEVKAEVLNKENAKEQKVETSNKENVTTKKVENVKTQDNNKKVEDDKKFKKVENPTKIEKNQKDKTAKTKKEKKNTNIKNSYIVGIILVILVIIAIVVGVKKKQKTPQKTINETFSALKTGNIETASQYFNYENLMNISGLTNKDNMDTETQKLFFDKLDWNIKNVKIENDTANVEMEVTNKDFKTIIGSYMQKALKAVFSGNDLSNSQMESYLKDELQSETAPTTTVTKTITLTKQDGEWKINESDDLTDLILPGLRETINSLNSIDAE